MSLTSTRRLGRKKRGKGEKRAGQFGSREGEEETSRGNTRSGLSPRPAGSDCRPAASPLRKHLERGGARMRTPTRVTCNPPLYSGLSVNNVHTRPSNRSVVFILSRKGIGDEANCPRADQRTPVAISPGGVRYGSPAGFMA
jgi:hypothetical protein